ncbi:2,3-dihydroxybenzoate-AMP ligase [Parafrankia colletiae]|uniref:2,3-dihydroxybenzoate-AMP ligase n=1 Tax=Parafrankia colletiae TaxID=573497 RepID=A0A1S1R098_9ACTN|nr:AMP-binding protein [Parafrankia colletiae]MCK9900694.1 AMP-binding protein [Frankia sp. Cpl3]OHV38945.1 2,3-dihydroxybenzoate-AMP ligase [Parafrankia colletiae]
MTAPSTAPVPAPHQGEADEGWVRWPAEFVQRYQDAGYWGDQTLDGLLREWARRFGPATALVSGAERISYAALDEAVDDLSAGLASLGIGPGDHLVVHLPNRAEFVTVLFALMRLGAIGVMALPAHRRVEIEHFARLSGAVGYVVADRHGGFDYRELAREVVDAVPSVRHVLVAGDPGPGSGRGVFTGLAELAAAGRSARLAATSGAAGVGREPGDIALLLISGGTTGKPKLIPRTHRDYAYNARASAQVCGLTADDVYLVALPAAHNFPLACPGILGAFGVGATVVMASASSPDVVFDLIARERVTVTAAVPPLARLWVEAAGWEGPDTTSLRLVQVGGAKLDEGLAQRIPPTLGARVQQVFGMAEGLLNFTRLDDPDEIVFTSQGRPLAEADEIRVLDGSGRPVAPGQVGELWTRGPYTIRGYYRAAEHNTTVFGADGFFRTGDLVRQLPTGHLVVEGRVKDVINRGGENVSAGELEEHLLTHPAIALAAVVGLPDPDVGESVCAAVVPVAGGAVRLKEIKNYLRDRGLARFMLPDRLAVVGEFPYTAVGKIDKRELRRRLEQ